MSGPHDWSEGPGERTEARSRRGDADFYDHGSRTGYRDDDDQHYDDRHDEDGHYADGHYADGHYDDGHYEDEHYDEAAWPVVGAQAAEAGGSGPRSSRRQGRRRGAHPILKALGIAVVLVLLVAGGGVVWARTQIDPGGHRGALVTVVIPKGSTTTAIGDRLAADGVIHQGWLFALYIHLHGDGPLLPGTYRLQKNSPYSAAISALTAGPKIVTENLVVPEGYTVAQIAQRVAALPGFGLSAQKFLAAANDGAVRSPYEPAGVNNLEGLLFPATYPVRQGESEVDILEEMIGTFDDRAQALGLPADAAKLGMTPYQVVTVASIVEREAKVAADRPNVASAIYNRLKIGMKLGADSTQTYYMRLTDPGVEPTAAQLDRPSPYNTRTNPGLPPTPIANPGLAALEAAANPPATRYLYFVEINPDGKLGFAATNSGFEQLRKQCQAAGLC